MKKYDKKNSESHPSHSEEIPPPKFQLHDFPYDTFQKKSIAAIDRGHSLMVAAPTGAGKTVLAEYVTHAALQEGKGILYTAPIKALSNQKYRDFCKRYGREQVGILTGDVVLNAQAPVLIMTTEIFRNRLFEPDDMFTDRRWVIFDEIHYLDDFERGTVWEESLIFFPDHLKLLALSATIPNIRELAKWVSGIHERPVDVIVEKERPVPLHFQFMAANRFFGSTQTLLNKVYRGKKSAVMRYHGKYRPTNILMDLLEKLKREDQCPAIFFCFSRIRCELLAKQSRDINLVTDEEREQLVIAYNELLETFQMTGDHHAEAMRPYIEQGIAYHHAGILPVLKEIIERLFTGKMIKLIFTTETFAIGINMPAKSVVFDQLRKFYGFGFDFLKTRDFFQMAGRAGRRGFDDFGRILICLNPAQIPYNALDRIVHGSPEPALSRFNSNYATLLQLYRLRGEAVLEIYPQSFHYFQASKRQKKKCVKSLENKFRLLEFMGYLDDKGLTSRGLFASRIYGYELPATELFMQGFFEQCEPWEMGCMITAMIFDPRKGLKPPRLTKPVHRLKRIADSILVEIALQEEQYGQKGTTKRLYFHLSEAVIAWMEGATLEELCKITDVDEGEIIRNFRMTIQILRELAGMPDLSETYYKKIKHCQSLLKRDCMDAEAQLKLG